MFNTFFQVEELQIKSNLIEQYTANNQDEKPTTSAQAAFALHSTPLMLATDSVNMQQTNDTLDMEGIEDINKQMLAIESLLVPMNHKKFKEDQEEEDDEEDEYMYSPNEETEDDEIERILS